MALTDPKVRQAKPRASTYKISDEKGLYLEVRPNGAKYWRHKYRFAGKEKLLSHGVYPDVTLAEARVARDEARRLLREGVDPSRLRRMTTKTPSGKLASSQNTWKGGHRKVQRELARVLKRKAQQITRQP